MTRLSRLLKDPIAANAAGLYVLQFTGFILPLVTLPYLARVLGPHVFGLLAFYQAFALWFSVIFEYGFNLSGTREVARFRGNKERLGRLASSILGAKLLLLLFSLLLLAPFAVLVPTLREHLLYLLWALIQAIAFGFSPFWYFQGTERLLKPVVLEFTLRLLSTIGIFVLVNNPDDGWKALALQATSGLFTTFISLFWVYREVGCVKLSCNSSLELIYQGWNLFVLKSLQSLYGSVNAFILGLLADSLAVGYYSGAEKLYKATLSLMSPILQALYPRISFLSDLNHKKGKKIYKLAIWSVTLTACILAGLIFIIAPTVVNLILGPGYEPAVVILQTLAIAIPFNLASTAIIMLRLLPGKLELAAGRVVLVGGVVNFVGAVLFAPTYKHVGMSWVVVITELLILAGLVFYLRLVKVYERKEP
ncbi:oligosaccharide flippase family protein [Meiothermus sp.]|uniref:oligosaccharide flippase family protein n=1 Tax=Meiothermus sp. TaxID=1955249 RepID=UPI0021DDD1CE|nr:oligosaccharide flippase family protein [Meiothermus sp.]GIW24934.1 MAG: O-antigen transporter [Meiothermus sp.]